MAAIIVGFIFGFAGSMPVAGPIAVLVFSRAVALRYATGLRIAIGAAVSEGIYAGLAYWGVSELFERHPYIIPASRLVAAAIMMLLGAKLFLRPPRPSATEELRGRKRALLLGFTISAVNPTLIATYTVVVAMLLGTGLIEIEAWHSLLFGGAAALGTIAWFASLLIMVRRYRSQLSPETLPRLVKIMGAALVVTGLVFALGS